jgi:hypothetical protein
MGLIEVLTIEVGAVIAKAIVRVWLRSEDAMSDSGADVIDLIRGKTSDIVAQRNGTRQVEAIGDQIALSLLPFFEVEGRGLSESSRIAIALAVADSLRETKINPKLLVRYNLEPSALASDIIAAMTARCARDFSAQEEALYNRVIHESCQAIIDIASQLPQFTERTFAEVLRREDQLLRVASEILNEMRMINSASQQGETERARFETEYRLSVARNLDRLELFGVDVSSASRRHRLSIAYVSLTIRHSSQIRKAISETDAILGNSAAEGRVSVEVALARAKRLLIGGIAGSGKTTLMQWIAVKSARHEFPEQLYEWIGTVPFLIRLRQCVDTTLPSPEQFPYYVAPIISGKVPYGWVHEWLASGSAIVLIDGVDEVPEAKRNQVIDWLEDLIMSYPNARYVVTSRQYAVSDKWLTRLGFDYCEMQPMDMNAIDEFIDHWHKAVQGELREDDDILAHQSLPVKLKREIRLNRSLRELATNPLLCAMLCALHRDRTQHLPSDRIELYEAGCYMLLERLDPERHIKLQDYPRLTYRQKENLLQDLAYWMLVNEWTEVPKNRAIDRLSRRVKHLDGLKESVDGYDVYRLFCERSGIVREPSGDAMMFAHRTFQEFLAAKAALDEVDIGMLVNHGHDDMWREVIILAAGLARLHERTELIEGLINRGYKEKRYKYRLHLLATACLETSIEVSTETKTKVNAHLQKLVPPKNFDEAWELSTAGELAIPFLEAQPDQLEEVAAACVKTLVLIGGEAALAKLKRYAIDTRERVLIELLDGQFQFPDRLEYSDRILSGIQRVRLKNISELHGIEGLKDLLSLDLSGSDISDLTDISKLIALRALNLKACCYVTDIVPLSSLAKLQRLWLSGCNQITDLNPLEGLENLYELRIDDCTSLTDLEPLTKLPSLRRLDLRRCKRATRLTILQSIPSLYEVWLDGIPQQQIMQISPHLLKRWKPSSQPSEKFEAE